MFGSNRWKRECLQRIQHLEAELADLKKTESEIRSQNHRLLQILRNMGRKLVHRLPLSMESLEKGLGYDLIFGDEIEAWRNAVPKGLLLDLRPYHEYAKGCIPGSYNIPFDQLSTRLESLAKERPILLICENGIRSVAAFEALSSKAYSYLYVLKGGMSLYRGPVQSLESKEEAPVQAVHA